MNVAISEERMVMSHRVPADGLLQSAMKTM